MPLSPTFSRFKEAQIHSLAIIVADASSLAVLPNGKDEKDTSGGESGKGKDVEVLVVGVGMEVWRIPRSGVISKREIEDE